MGSSRVRAALGRLAREWASVVYPEECILCAAPAAVVCSPCCMRLSALPVRCETMQVRGFSLPLYSCDPSVADDVRRIVAAYKDRQVRAAVTPLAGMLSRGLAAAWAQHPQRLRVVPVPPTRRAVRRRGYVPLCDVLRRTAYPPGATVHLNGLSWTRAVADQRGLDRNRRADNLRGAMVCRDPDLAGAPVVVVDDVVTTGATIHAATEALLSAAAVVTGVVALTHIPGRRQVASERQSG